MASGEVRPSTKYRPIVLSHKHKPTDTEEKERIEKEGGMVFHGRVCGSLAVSRGMFYAAICHIVCTIAYSKM